jgi:hypothetical protein
VCAPTASTVLRIVPQLIAELSQRQTARSSQPPKGLVVSSAEQLKPFSDEKERTSLPQAQAADLDSSACVMRIALGVNAPHTLADLSKIRSLNLSNQATHAYPHASLLIMRRYSLVHALARCTHISTKASAIGSLVT